MAGVCCNIATALLSEGQFQNNDMVLLCSDESRKNASHVLNFSLPSDSSSAE